LDSSTNGKVLGSRPRPTVHRKAEPPKKQTAKLEQEQMRPQTAAGRLLGEQTDSETRPRLVPWISLAAGRFWSNRSNRLGRGSVRDIPCDPYAPLTHPTALANNTCKSGYALTVSCAVVISVEHVSQMLEEYSGFGLGWLPGFGRGRAIAAASQGFPLRPSEGLPSCQYAVFGTIEGLIGGASLGTAPDPEYGASLFTNSPAYGRTNLAGKTSSTGTTPLVGLRNHGWPDDRLRVRCLG